MGATVQTERKDTGTGTWTIDGAHSVAEFAVKHMMVSTVKGRFKNVSGALHLDEANPAASRIEAAIEVASVDTGAEQRDEHLRSDDFFNAARYPQITFRSTGVSGKGDDWKMEGELTIRDVTKPVVLDVEFEGRGPDAYGGERAGFTATTKINRKDFGVNWNGLIEAGGVVVSDTVKITLNIEAVRQV
ncbi:MAG: YceI family protein [Chloroflexi bacterium]|nr:YceI family protein [Chloroflexota bacterium]